MVFGWAIFRTMLAVAAAGVVVTPQALEEGPRPAATPKARLETLGFKLDADSFLASVQSGNRFLMEMFLKSGVDVNAADANGRTALFTAVVTGQWPMMDSLLEHGADPNQADSDGRTPLMAAVLQREPTAVERLIKAGADPATKDKAGHSALHYALITKDKRMALPLMHWADSVGGPCCQDHDLYAHAVETQDWTLVAPLITAAKPATLKWQSQTRIWFKEALEKRDSDRARLLMSKHAGAPTPEGGKQPWLAYAIASGQTDLLRFLLEAGADPNAALVTAPEKQFLSYIPAQTVVRQYLADEPGMTPLMLAAGLGRVEDIKTLLSYGAKRGKATGSKYRLVAINFAAWAKSADALQALIEKAPSPDKLRIEISISSQSAVLYKDGVAVMRTSISTGRPGYPTPEGSFVVTDKAASHQSTIYKVPMPFFMRLNCREFGMHEGYAQVPFASHGCIRVPAEAARRLYREVPIGTLVRIGP